MAGFASFKRLGKETRERGVHWGIETQGGGVGGGDAIPRSTRKSLPKLANIQKTRTGVKKSGEKRSEENTEEKKSTFKDTGAGRIPGKRGPGGKSKKLF